MQIPAGNSISERHKRGCSGYHTSKFATSEPKVQLVHRRSCKGGNYTLSWKQPEYWWHSFTDLGVQFRNRRLYHWVRYSLQQMKFFSCSMLHFFIHLQTYKSRLPYGDQGLSLTFWHGFLIVLFSPAKLLRFILYWLTSLLWQLCRWWLHFYPNGYI